MACGQQIVIKKPNHTHTSADITDFNSAVDAIVDDNLTVISNVSANWNSVYYTVNSLSSIWESPDGNVTGFVHLSGDVMTGSLSAPSISCDTLYVGASTIYFIQNGIVVNSFNSQDVNIFRNTYSTVQTNSATNWNYQGTDIKALTGNWNQTYTNFSTQSANNLSVYTTVNTNSATNWNYQGTDIKALTGNWQNTYSTVNTNSATNWNYQGTDIKALTGNWNQTYTNFSTQSANNLSVYSTVQSNSGSWGGGGGGVTGAYLPLSGGTMDNNAIISFDNYSRIRQNPNGTENGIDLVCSIDYVHRWKDGFLYIYDQSNQIRTVYYGRDLIPSVNYDSSQGYIVGSIYVQDNGNSYICNDNSVGAAVWEIWNTVGNYLPLSGGTLTGSLSTTNVLYTNGGNSNQWNSSYTTINTNSATNWNYQGTDIKSLTGNWQNTYIGFSSQSANNLSVYNSFNSNSSNYNSVYSTVNTNSGSNWNYQGTDIKSLTSNWQNTYTNFSTQSSNNLNVYTTVYTNSATNWNYQGTDIKSLTGNWQNTYSTVNSYSATWGTGGSPQTLSFNESNAQLTISDGNTVSLSALSGNSVSSGVSYLSALNDVYIPSPVNGQVLTYSSVLQKWTTGSPASASGQTGYYGAFYDTTAQTLTGTNEAKRLGIANTFEANGVSLSANTIVFNNTGTYEIIFSIQYKNTSASQEDIYIWFRKNGVDIPDSSSVFTIPARKSAGIPAQLIAVTPFIATLAANDFIEIFWHCNTTAVTVETFTTHANPTIPDTPGVIITVKQVTNVQLVPTVGAYLPLSGGTITGVLSTTNVIYANGGNSNEWNSSYTTVNTNSANWNYQGNDVKALTGNWNQTYTNFSAQSANNVDVYTAVNQNSGDWNYQGTDVKALTGNWQNTYANFSSQSANNLNVYTAVNSNSANWNYQGTDIKSLTGNWNQTYTNFSIQSANNLSVYSSFNSNSSNYDSVYNNVNSNSATNWNYQGTDIKSLTGNWQASYTALTSSSANWNDTRNTVQTNSANWNYQGTDIKSLTSNWQNTYANFSSQSANNLNVYTNVNTNSSNWNYQGTDIKSLTSNWDQTYTNFSAQSANNLNVYTAVNSNSANWNYQGTDIKSLTSNWQNTYTNFRSQSANNLSVYTNVRTNSASWALGTVTSVGLSSANSTLTIGSTPITGSGIFTADLNLAKANTWTGQQTFNSAATVHGVGVITPTIIGGNQTNSSLVIESTSIAGSADYINFQTGGNANAMRINTNGYIGINAVPAVNAQLYVESFDGPQYGIQVSNYSGETMVDGIGIRSVGGEIGGSFVGAVYGVYATANNSTYSNAGVYGEGTYTGVKGQGSYKGVHGIATGSTGAGGYFTNSGSGYALIADSGNSGFGTTLPSTKLHIISPSNLFRAGYNTSNYLDINVGSTGIVTYDAVGSGAVHRFSENIQVPASGYYNFGTTNGSAGYGFRDNAGVVEAKSSGGLWAPIGNTSVELSSIYLYLANDNTWTGQQTFNSAATVHGVGVITPKIYPATDSISAVRILKADGTTNIVTVDTTNQQVGIGGMQDYYKFSLQSIKSVSGIFDSEEGLYVGNDTDQSVKGAYILAKQTNPDLYSGKTTGLKVEAFDAGVTGNGSVVGVHGIAGGGPYVGNTIGVLGVASTTDSNAYGVRGVGFNGVAGIATTTFAGRGVYGQISSSTGYAMYAANFNSDGYSFYSVFGRNYMQNKLGLNTTSPATLFHAIATSNLFRAGYDTSNYLNIDVGSTGIVTYDAVGSAAVHRFNDNIQVPLSGYYNFGTIDGSSGYGFRDNAGVVEAKSSGGLWSPIGGSAISDAAYDSSWNGVTNVAPSKNAVYDQLQLMISDAAYDSSWNGVSAIAPSKNAVYDQLQLMQSATSVKSLSSNQSTAANTTAIVLPGMSFDYAANATYKIEIIGAVSSAAATTGYAFNLDLSTAITAIYLTGYSQLANTGTVVAFSQIADAANTGITSGVPTLNTPVPVMASGILITSSNSGTAQLQYRSETTAVTTCLSGTTMIVTKIA
jgi:hypothetical protein